MKTESAQEVNDSPHLVDQLQRWLFQGNPVLKVAISILVIGIILLLRFATEHWQLSLAAKLGLVALASGGIAGLGYRLMQKIGVLLWHWKDWVWGVCS